MDRSYGRGAARRIFWQGILDRSYEGFIRFFVATLCCRRQLNAFWQMLAWLALALPPLALLGSQQPAAEAGNASQQWWFAHCSFFWLHFWTPVMSPPAAIYFYDSIFGPQLWTPILYFLLTNFETCTCTRNLESGITVSH